MQIDRMAGASANNTLGSVPEERLSAVLSAWSSRSQFELFSSFYLQLARSVTPTLCGRGARWLMSLQ
jgi:hypothetical protein